MILRQSEKNRYNPLTETTAFAIKTQHTAHQIVPVKHRTVHGGPRTPIKPTVYQKAKMAEQREMMGLPPEEENAPKR